MTIQTYRISNIPQMIDISGDALSSTIKCQVSSPDKIPFSVTIADQETIDSGAEFQYEDVVEGIYGVEIENNNKQLYLILKSTIPSNINVDIMSKKSEHVNDIIKKSVDHDDSQDINEHEKSTSWSKIILIAIVVIVLLYFVYKFLIKRKDSEIKPLEKQTPSGSPENQDDSRENISLDAKQGEEVNYNLQEKNVIPKFTNPSPPRDSYENVASDFNSDILSRINRMKVSSSGGRNTRSNSRTISSNRDGRKVGHRNIFSMSDDDE